MMAESLEGLALQPDGFYVDCTFGRGGHSEAILARLGKQGRLLALDRDSDAVSSNEAVRLQRDKRFQIERASHSELLRWIDRLGWQGEVSGVLMDLGVSSPQLDQAERGFSFLRNGPLDMRMDRDGGLSAADWLRWVGEKELEQVLREFGEERYARRVARAIVEQRERVAIETTKQLATIVANAIPRWERGQHPATRSFQAIRIEINQELRELREGISQATAALRAGGRLVVIAFHSLEDRIVKRFIRDESRGFAERADGRGPISAEWTPRLRRVGGPRKPREEEIRENARARSAVLRVAERLAE